MRGKHGDLNTIRDAIYFITQWDTETVSIGGGEPTLHPDFFEILKLCLSEFDYVWMATNGSKTDIMYRLSSIIDGHDEPDIDCDCTEQELEDNGCLCYEKHGHEFIWNEDKLSVALSQDCFHDPINHRIVELWSNRAKQQYSHYEIRNVNNSNSGIIAEGRAKKTGSGWNEDDCVCADIFIRPDGKIKLCGCRKSPIIGDIRNGIEPKWEDVICNDEDYQDSRCHKALTGPK
jgi:MoaA/NifB/PqqE/SkfB family radical SAM enzyme